MSKILLHFCAQQNSISSSTYVKQTRQKNSRFSSVHKLDLHILYDNLLSSRISDIIPACSEAFIYSLKILAALRSQIPKPYPVVFYVFLFCLNVLGTRTKKTLYITYSRILHIKIFLFFGLQSPPMFIKTARSLQIILPAKQLQQKFSI